jgi:glycosyltransferase involved in cell wall biosynthesis
VNGYASLERSESVGGEQARNLRLVTLCGSIKPLFSGTDDFHENLVEVLRRKQVDARPVDLKQWRVAQVPELLRRVAAERPDAILMQYPTDAFSAALGPHVFSALQRQAPLVVTLHEFAAANPIRRASVGVLLARCAAVVATAETERRSLVAWFPWLKARSCVIPIGGNFPGREWRPSEPPIVVYFGQIRPEKGLEEFIACKDVLAAQFPSAKFVVAGSRVPKFASYYQTIEIEARNRGIDVLGEMAPERVPDFLRTPRSRCCPTHPARASVAEACWRQSPVGFRSLPCAVRKHRLKSLGCWSRRVREMNWLRRQRLVCPTGRSEKPPTTGAANSRRW